jgi:hypothetical protein
LVKLLVKLLDRMHILMNLRSRYRRGRRSRERSR